MMVPSPLGSPASSIPAPSRATDGLPTLRLLGGAIIVGADGKPLGGPAAHRHRIALLALLAVSGLMSRDKLVAYLWPERDSAGARNLLKTAVHGLRKVLGDDAIESIGDQLQLNTARLRCDVTDFEAAVTAADWSLADSLYTGPFLDGFFVKGASDFEDWTSARRMRLDEAYARVVRELRARETTDPGSRATAEPLLDASGSLAADAVPAETAPPTTPPRQTRRRLAAWFGIGVIAAALIFVAQRQGFGVGQPAKPTAVILPDDDPGTALEFNGVDTDVSTVDGSVITPQTDDIAWDMLVRFDGPTGARMQTLFYNGHTAWSGWGVIVLGRGDQAPDGTLGVLAGGVSITATPLVLKRGVWQHVTAERRGGKVTLWLDDQSYVAGVVVVNPLGGGHHGIEHTAIGASGTLEAPREVFHGAIDRVRVRDLASDWNIDQWFFDEGRGAVTVGRQGGVLRTGSARWIKGFVRSNREGYWTRMEALCGHAYGGRAVGGDVADSTANPSLIVLHVSRCTPLELRITLHIGDDHSRIWTITRTNTGLRLVQERFHPDGSVDRASSAMGETAGDGMIARQEFRFGNDTTVLEIDPLKTLVYRSTRNVEGPRRLEFDLARVLASPPAAWGDK